MNYSNKASKKVALFLVALMFSIIPNLPVYSAVGSYQNSSMAITANQSSSLSGPGDEIAGWPLAVAAGVALAVVVVVGVVDGWNSVDGNGPSEEQEDTLSRLNHNRNDFSRFDN